MDNDFREDGELSDSGSEIEKEDEMPHDHSIVDYNPIDRPIVHNPIYNVQQERYNSSASEQDSDSDSSTDHIKKKQKMKMLSSAPARNIRKNNIWSNLLMEESLIKTIENVGVKNVRKIERNVESYALPKEFQKDDDEDSSASEEQQENKQKRVFMRVKRRNNNCPGKLRHITQLHGEPLLLNKIEIKENMTADELATEIAAGLHEQKKDLILRIVNTIGMESALQLYQKTQAIEENGGLMIVSGNRRRTSGGVYINLLKSLESVNKETIDRIFEEDNKSNNVAKKRKRQRQRMKEKGIEFDKEVGHLEGAKCPGSTPVPSPQTSDSDKNVHTQHSTEPSELLEACEKVAMEVEEAKDTIECDVVNKECIDVEISTF